MRNCCKLMKRLNEMKKNFRNCDSVFAAIGQLIGSSAMHLQHVGTAVLQCIPRSGPVERKSIVGSVRLHSDRNEGRLSGIGENQRQQEHGDRRESRNGELHGGGGD